MDEAAQPLARALDAIGDPWSFLILQEAFFGVRRFDDFQRNLGIARNTLTDRVGRLIDLDLLIKRADPARPARHEYRLTARGIDTYAYALMLTQWGDEWLAGPEGPPVTLHHKTCGKRLAPLAICDACGRGVRAEDVAISAGSVHAPAPPQATPVRYSSRPQLYTAGRPTSVGRTLAAIGDRWGFFVLWLALAGVTRFDHFHSILGIARTTLTARLDRLLETGLLTRTLYRERPARYDYSLTAMGRALCPVLLTLFEWGQRWPRPADATAHALHKSCGKPLTTVVICGHCRAPVTARDVHASPVKRDV